MEEGWKVSIIARPQVSAKAGSLLRRAFATEAPRSFGMNGGTKFAYRRYFGTAVFERLPFYTFSAWLATIGRRKRRLDFKNYCQKTYQTPHC